SLSIAFPPAHYPHYLYWHHHRCSVAGQAAVARWCHVRAWSQSHQEPLPSPHCRALGAPSMRLLPWGRLEVASLVWFYLLYFRGLSRFLNIFSQKFMYGNTSLFNTLILSLHNLVSHTFTSLILKMEQTAKC